MFSPKGLVTIEWLVFVYIWWFVVLGDLNHAFLSSIKLANRSFFVHAKQDKMLWYTSIPVITSIDRWNYKATAIFREKTAASQDGWAAGGRRDLLGLWGSRPLLQLVGEGPHHRGGGRGGRGADQQPGKEEDGELVRRGGEEKVGQVSIIIILTSSSSYIFCQVGGWGSSEEQGGSRGGAAGGEEGGGEARGERQGEEQEEEHQDGEEGL